MLYQNLDVGPWSTEPVTLPMSMRKTLPPDVTNESASSIDLFSTCELKWVGSRCNPSPRAHTRFTVVGEIVHRVMEVFWNEPAHERSVDLLRETLDRVWTTLQIGNVDDGIVSEEIVESLRKVESTTSDTQELRGFIFNRASEMIRNSDEFDPDPASSRVLCSSRTVIGSVPSEYSPNGAVLVRAKIDRTDQGKGGDLILKDYRTGRCPDVDQVSIEDPFFRGLLVGAWILHGKSVSGMEPDVKAVQLIYLRDAVSISKVIKPSDWDYIDSYVRNAVHGMSAVSGAMTEPTATRAADKNSGQCRGCLLVNQCPMWGGSLE